MFEIIPGILEKDWNEIERKINIAKKFAKSVHIDIIDGKFAPNTTFLDPMPFAKYSKEVLFEVHLMVEEPIDYLKRFAAAGFRRFLGHVEKMSDQVEFVAEGQTLGEVGLAIDAPTAIDAIEVALDDLDFVTVMTVKAGFSGQEFLKEILEKVKVVRSKTQIPIEVDGGINDKTIIESMKAGASRFVVTSFVLGNKSPQEQYNLLNDCLHQVTL